MKKNMLLTIALLITCQLHSTGERSAEAPAPQFRILLVHFTNLNGVHFDTAHAYSPQDRLRCIEQTRAHALELGLLRNGIATSWRHWSIGSIAQFGPVREVTPDPEPFNPNAQQPSAT